MSNNILNAVERYKYAFAFWTDRADFITDKTADLREDTLLEIRCFDESGEYRAVRDLPGKPFSEREITADEARADAANNVFREESYADGYFDEAQYLDVDENVTREKKDGWTYATGGGRYHLPEDARNSAMILVRFYYRFDEEGIAHKCDWRLVDFTDAETVGKGE